MPCRFYAHKIQLVYDVTSRTSFENIIMWLNELEVYAGTNIVKMLVGNKTDKVTLFQIGVFCSAVQ